MGATTRLDVLYVTDLRFPGGSSTSLYEEVQAAVGAGYRVGALQARSASLRADRAFHPGLQRLIDEGRLLLVRPGEPVHSGLAIVKHPTVLTESFGGRLPIRADSLVVFVGQVPVDVDGTVYYEPNAVHANVEEAFGMVPKWSPVSPTVRRSLEPSGVPLDGFDWPEVIDTVDWAVDRGAPRGEVPIIGRHGRPSKLKWPGDPETLATVYPLDGSAEVHVLGGVDGLEAVLSEVPKSWTVWDFGSRPVLEFLAEIDFFVYFHHPNMVEAFGRAVIEAMSAGCVAVLPPEFSELFGDGCVYAEATEVPAIVTAHHRDPEAFLAQSCRAVEVVDQRFSHSAHITRIRGLVGEPTGATGRVAPTGRIPGGFATQRPKILVACLGLGPESTAEAVREIVEHRDRRTTFEAVVLCDSPAPTVSDLLGEELELDGSRRCFVGARSGVMVEVVESRESFSGPGRWEDYVLAAMSRIRRSRAVSGVVVVDPAHPDAWLALQSAG